MSSCETTSQVSESTFCCFNRLPVFRLIRLKLTLGKSILDCPQAPSDHGGRKTPWLFRFENLGRGSLFLANDSLLVTLPGGSRIEKQNVCAHLVDRDHSPELLYRPLSSLVADKF